MAICPSRNLLGILLLIGATTGCALPNRSSGAEAVRRPPRRERADEPAPDAGPSGPAAPTSAADETPDLLAMLVENGALTQAQYEQLAADPRFAPFTKAAPDTPQVPAAPREPDGQPRVILDESGLSVRSADGESRIDIGGRLQADATAHSRNSQAGEDITDGTELRRARLELKGELPQGWIWAAEADFADNETSLKDFWAGVENPDGTRVMFGHQKQPYSLSVEMSSNDIPFTERGVDTALIVPFVDRAIGVRADVPFENSFFAAGLFGESVSPDDEDDDEGWGTAMRFVHAPIRDDEQVVHLGVRGAVRVPNSSDQAVRIRDETTHMSNFSVVDTGMIMDVDHTTLLGAEFAWATGPFSLVGEYNRANIQRSAGGDLDFESWSLESAYSLTGESRAAAYRMDAGEFKRLEPATTAEGLDVTSGGAWELAARVANLDLNDGAVDGGEENVLTLGVNWYPTDFARFLLGWSNVLSTRGGDAATADADGLDAVTLRAQLLF